jgi:GH15 family glucan-1,4-alpha-glucosidase
LTKSVETVPDYLPIEDHAVIGDLHTVALVGANGTIDWCCLPRFDAPSVFGALLDKQLGGHFSLSHTGARTTKQLYLPDSNVLMTRFLGADSVGEVIDFMVPFDPLVPRTHGHPIVRRARSVRGRVAFDLTCAPAFDYGRAAHEVRLVNDVGAVFDTPEGSLVLRSTVPLEIEENAVRAHFEIESGATADFFLEWHGEVRPPQENEADWLFSQTMEFWQRWIRRSRYEGRWREMVERSALCLKLLVYAPTGALVAAPTTSLPELIGGERNWDYRYTWVRDAAYTLYGLMRLGFTDEAAAFMHWLEERCREAKGTESLQALYGIDGRHDLPEETLDHLEGYRGSKPVRIGNGAATQLQLDIYGELMDSVYLFNKYGAPISYDLWMALSEQLEWLADNWEQPDDSIWETRGGRQPFTYSRLMTWVAYERALRIARSRGLPSPVLEWQALADRAYTQVQKQGWNPARNAYVQYHGSERLDASVLVMPLVKFAGPTDPRFIATLERIEQELTSDSLVMRYKADGWDGLEGQDGTFNLCSFWYVEALARAQRLTDARLTFEKMLTYANHVGLYAEEISPAGEAVGNFPQAFTHLALISAAVNLDRASELGR